MLIAKWQLRRRRKRIHTIIQNQDWDGLFRLENDGDFTRCLESMIWATAGNDYTPPKEPIYRVLYLCMFVEDCIQSGSLWGVFDEGLAAYMPEAAAALGEIGAIRSAAALQEVVAALPAGGYPAEDLTACRAFSQTLDQADDILCDYPDGPMHRLYYAYAKAHREDFP